jgi:flagellar basal body rod protein FlgC
MLSPMSSALAIAAGGLQAASRSFETAARTIVSAGATATESVGQAAEPAASGGAPLAAVPPFEEGPDLFEGLIDLKLAEISYKANAKVFAAASRLEDSLLDILA